MAKQLADVEFVRTPNNKQLITSSHILSSPTPSIDANPQAAADTGASRHFLGISNAVYLDNVEIATQPITVELPNHTHIVSTHVAYLPTPTQHLSHSTTGALISGPGLISGLTRRWSVL